MSILQSVTTGLQRRPLKTLIYGPEGVGKSTFCAHPGTIWICAEDGTSHLNISRLPSGPTWEDVYKYLEALRTDDHNYWGVVIDSVDWLQHIAGEFIGQRERQDIESIPYGKGAGMLADEMLKFLRAVDRLVNERGLDVYMIAHAQIVQFDDPTGDSYSRWQPALSKKVVGPVKEWADNILFCQFDEYTKTTGKGFSERQVGKSTGGRVLLTEHRPGHDGKNRFKLPYKIPYTANAHNTYRQMVADFYNQ